MTQLAGENRHHLVQSVQFVEGRLGMLGAGLLVALRRQTSAARRRTASWVQEQVVDVGRELTGR